MIKNLYVIIVKFNFVIIYFFQYLYGPRTILYVYS